MNKAASDSLLEFAHMLVFEQKIICDSCNVSKVLKVIINNVNVNVNSRFI